jgi:integrase
MGIVGPFRNDKRKDTMLFTYCQLVKTASGATLRHTYASMMLSAGENPAWIARQMGHADWGMIRRTYARWMPDVEPNAGEKASSWWAKNTAQNLSKPATKK